MKTLLAVITFLAVSSAAYGQLSRGYGSVVDGVVTLNGTFNKLAGINASSKGGYLSRGDGTLSGVTIPGSGHAPWGFGEPSFIANTPFQISYGVLGSEAAIDVSGVTPTAILYSGPDIEVCGDLSVEIGVDGDTTPKSLLFCLIPEPNAASSAAIGLLGVLSFIRRRR